MPPRCRGAEPNTQPPDSSGQPACSHGVLMVRDPIHFVGEGVRPASGHPRYRFRSAWGPSSGGKAATRPLLAAAQIARGCGVLLSCSSSWLSVFSAWLCLALSGSSPAPPPTRICVHRWTYPDLLPCPATRTGPAVPGLWERSLLPPTHKLPTRPRRPSCACSSSGRAKQHGKQEKKHFFTPAWPP